MVQQVRRLDPSQTWQISLGTDDGDTNYYDHGYCVFDGGTIYLGRYSGTSAMVDFLRFLNIGIPKGSTIISAVLSFYSTDNQSSTVCKVDITGDDEGNCATYSTCADLWARPRTTASVAWDGIESWVSNTWHNSIDISAVIQEIINRDDWVSGNALGIFIDGYRSSAMAQRYYVCYDGSPALSAKLTITWWEAPPPGAPKGGSIAAKLVAAGVI